MPELQIGDAAASCGDSSSGTAKLALTPPVFDGTNSQIFFLKLERYFNHYNIKDPQLKFTVTINCINTQDFSQILENCIREANSVADPYSLLKTRICTETTPSAEEKLKKLLSFQKLGDLTCVQFLNNLKTNVSPDQVNSPFIREIFLQGLPSDVRAILAIGTYANLDSMAIAADKVIVAKGVTREINAVEPNHSNLDVIIQQLSELNCKVVGLQAQVFKLQSQIKYNNGNFNARSKSRGRSCNK